MPSRVLLQNDQQAADQLVRLVQQTGPGHGVVALLGSGLSTILGYPDWTAVLGRIASIAGRLSEFEKSLDDASEFPGIAESCRHSMSEEGREDQYYAELEALFPAKAPWPQGELSFRAIHTDILRCNFSAFLTTNYDLSLDHAADDHQDEALLGGVSVCRTSALDRNLLSEASRRIYYLHGTVFDTYGAAQPREAVLTRSDYDRAYANGTGPVCEFLHEAFLSHTVLFVGCGFEPDIRQVLRRFREWRQEHGLERRHFALCPVDQAPPGGAQAAIQGKRGPENWETLLDEYGVQPLRYGVVASDSAHDALNNFFQSLSRTGSAQYRPTAYRDLEGVPR
jgi:hypothetical protein